MSAHKIDTPTDFLIASMDKLNDVEVLGQVN
jgi:hypothetical protein